MRNLNRVHLGGLRAIEAVGRLGSLKAAAEEMGITVGAVSQKVQKAERQLEHVLFERRPRGLTLTPQGREVARLLTGGMSELSAAISLTERSREDTLTISVAPVFAEKWLVWRLKVFNDAHPAIRIRVEATVALVDPNASDVDVCIRVGDGQWSGVVAEEFLKHKVFPVCSHEMAADLKTPSDLANVPIIRDPPAMFGWNTWLEPNGLDESILGAGPVFSNASLCFDAAMAGQGVFLAWDTLAGDSLVGGRIAAPFPDRHPSGISYWLVTSQHTADSPSVQKFKAWLRKEVAVYT